jgi:hypothetical protein
MLAKVCRIPFFVPASHSVEDAKKEENMVLSSPEDTG